MLTRRLALFRIASSSAVAAAPDVLKPVQAKTPETPELVDLGRELIGTVQQVHQLRQIRDDARTQVMALWPSFPQNLSSGFGHSDAEAVNEIDCDDKPINHGGNYHLAHYKHYYSAESISDRLAELPACGGTNSEKRERRLLKRLLPIANEYDQATSAAVYAHDYRAKARAYNLAAHAVEHTMRLIAKLPALTPEGITIKAQAYQACSSLGKEEGFQAAIHLGPGLAADVCRVLSEEDEA
jgi:hypothetical protein